PQQVADACSPPVFSRSGRTGINIWEDKVRKAGITGLIWVRDQKNYNFTVYYNLNVIVIIPIKIP
ncbi:hypothetical protein UA45_16470, partial [Morganella morganii]